MEKTQMKTYISPDIKKEAQKLAVDKEISLSLLVELALNKYMNMDLKQNS